MAKEFIKNYSVAIISFVIVLLTTVIFYLLIQGWTRKNTQVIFENQTGNIEARIEKRINFYILLLQCGKSFFLTTDTVTKEKWSKFINNLNIEKEIPGIQGMGFAEYVPKNALLVHINSMRNKGRPDYEVKPKGEREEYTPIVYLEPLNWRNQRAVGFDMFSESVRREAMIRARDKDEPALSGKVVLVQETSKNVQFGFLIYTPVYNNDIRPVTIDERRNNIKGYIYSPFRMEDFIEAIFQNESYGIDFEIFDGQELKKEYLLYNSDSTLHFRQPFQRGFHKVSHVVVGGRSWTIFYSTKNSYEMSSAHNLQLTVLFGGVVISILIFSLAFFISKGKREEEKSNEQLFRQNEELKKINTDLDNFIYTASHDLKAPIANIEGLINTLPDVVDSETRQNEEFQTITGMIYSSILKFKTTIKDLADISKIQRNFEDDKTWISFETVIKDTLDDLKQEIKKTEAKIEFDVSSCPQLYYSPRNLRSILYNLISNAIKYKALDRVPVVHISTEKNNDGCILIVKDNGLGIPSAKIGAIFGMFKRFHSHVEGTGIGLYIVKRIVDNNDGRIEVESKEGEGTTFKIFFNNKV